MGSPFGNVGAINRKGSVFSSAGSISRAGSVYSSAGAIPKKFGNVYGIPKLKIGSNKSMGSDQWERYYSGNWADIESWYDWTSQAGNALTTCLKSDGNWRCYRHDRGFQLREKPEDEEANVEDIGIQDFAFSFAKAFASSSLASFGIGTIKNAIQSNNIGIDLGLKAIKTSLGLMGGGVGSGSEESTDYTKIALNTGLSIAVAKSNINFKYKALIMPAAFLIQSLLSGKSLQEIIPSMLGYTLGSKLGSSLAITPTIKPSLIKGSSSDKLKTFENADVYFGKTKVTSAQPLQSDLLMARIKDKKKRGF